MLGEVKSVDGIGFLRLIVLEIGAHQGDERSSNGDLGRVLDLDSRRILAREERSGVNGLALGEHVRVLSTGGLLFCEPLFKVTICLSMIYI